jgi:hypothetical protein
MLNVLLPIEPVEPRMAMRFIVVCLWSDYPPGRSGSISGARRATES